MSQAPSTVLPDPGAPAGTIDADRYCIRCGYLLKGLLPAGKCPECGTEISLSLREPLLANAAPEYIQSLKRGLSLLLNGILLMIVVTIGLFAIGVAAPGVTGITWVAQLVMMGVYAMLFAGVWSYTQPDPSQVAAEEHQAARRAVRAAVVVQAGLTGLQGIIGFLQPMTPAPGGGLGGAVIITLLISVLGFLMWAVIYFVMMRYTRWIAGRIPDQYMVKRAKTYTWLLPLLTTVGMVAFGLGGLVALVLYWNLLDRLRKHVKAIAATGKPAALRRMEG